MSWDEIEGLIARTAHWPHRLPGTTSSENARFALAGMQGAVLTELRDREQVTAAVARIHLAWDSDQLRVQAARLVAIIPPEETARGSELISRACADAAAAGYRYLFTRIDAQDIATVQHFEAQGFRLVDALTTLYLPTANTTNLSEIAGIVVRQAGPDDAATAAAIVDACFVVSRFHCDPVLGLDRARAIYREWAINGLHGWNDLTLFAIDEQTGAVAGLLSCKEVVGSRRELGRACCRIELVAVMPAFRGKHVVGALTCSLLRAARTRDWDLLAIGTQISNIPALRSYLRVGFAPGDSIFTLRWWADSE